MSAALSGSLRVLIVEDEIIIALDLANMIEELGHIVVKLANRVDVGMEFASSGELDIAVLDMNVRGTLSFPIADVLRKRRIPFIFASGYGARGLIDDFQDALVLTKPYSSHDLQRTVALALKASV